MRDAMTPIGAVQAVTLGGRDEVGSRRRGCNAAALRTAAYAGDRARPECDDLRQGIFSSSQIARQLGIPVQTTSREDLAEIEAALHA